MVHVSMRSSKVMKGAHTHITIKQKVGSSGVDDGGLLGTEGRRRD
jgi:hypothetical protein